MLRLASVAVLILLALAAVWLGGTAADAPPAPAVAVGAAPAAATSAPAAAPVAAAASSATFGVFGDVNVSGSDTPAAVFGFVCAGIRRTGATVALSPGDALNDIADASVSTAVGRWNKYLAAETAGLGSSVVTWRAAGDNDRLDVPARLEAWNQVFADYPKTPDPARRWYAKKIKGVHLIFLSTAYAGHMGFLGYVSERSARNSAEAKWLVRRLRAVTAGSGRRTIVVVMHYPLIRGKTNKPYAGSERAEATALRALFAKYGVDMVLAGDTHVYRRTMVRVVKAGVRRLVPYIQIPPAASPPRRFGTSPIPALGAREGGWVPADGYRGFLKLRYKAAKRKLSLSVYKIAVGDGTMSAARDQKANANALGGTFADIPEGSRLR
ncbi:MAG TPA: metallophosphoesterase [Vicinamibacterales bacterium]|nr:metallophosphoesterase [Vicinamibacterales bacterium]